MKILIIGSKGFIGKNLTEYLSSRDYEVWGADVIVDYVNREKYFLIDPTNADFKPVFEKNKYQFCINCSGASSVPDSLLDPSRDYYLNTVNVFRLLDSIRVYNPDCRFINLSSAAVYGNPAELPVKESFNPNPLSPYGLHKWQAELLCKEFYDFYKVRSCSLRIFSVYGAGLRKQLFWDLYRKVKSGAEIKLFGTGEESRDFIYISDLSRAIEAILLNSGFRAEVVNVANGIEIKIKDAAGMFLGLFSPVPVHSFTGEERKGDPSNWKADIGKLSSFGYKPEVNIQNGLKMYYAWLTSKAFQD